MIDSSRLALACLAFFVACSGQGGPGLLESGSYRLVGGEVTGLGATEIEVRGGIITAVGSSDSELEAIDVSGKVIQPGWIDSHVHLAYLPESAAMASGGVAVAIDLGSPIEFLDDLPTELEVLASGPMVTAIGGYPTQGWGADGYGLEVSGLDEAVAATERLTQAGARVIKLPIKGRPALDEATLRAVVTAAHAHDLKVVSHAVTDAEAALAARVGCDALAHTPLESLSEETVAAWADGAVISTLGAFGGSEAAVDNLRRLAQAGATVLYGTDFGNTTTPGVDLRELRLLAAAGLSPEEILASATSVPAAYWGLPDYGSIEVGKRAVFRIVPGVE